MTNNVILIADDEPWQRMWITQMLHNAGYTCSAVSDGASVVEQALALAPGLIILDIEMPGVNGITAAEQLRVLPHTRNVPILFVTSYSKARDVLIASGIDRVEWMMKPFHPEDLLARVRRMMR